MACSPNLSFGRRRKHPVFLRAGTSAQQATPQRAFPRLFTLAALAAVCAVAGALSYFRVVTPNAFRHLKTGQVIIQERHLLHANLFSFTYPDYPWHNMEWLFQVFLALFCNAFGWGGVMAFKVALVQASATVLYFTLTARTRAPLLAAAVLLHLLALMRFRLSERPHLMSLLFFAIVIWAFEMRRRPFGSCHSFSPWGVTSTLN